MLQLSTSCLGGTTTFVTYGALLSESSARTTFPQLYNFRLVRVNGYRRCFAHPHCFLVSRGLTTGNRFASLSAEKSAGASFIGAAFSVELDQTQQRAFLEREAEYSVEEIDMQCIENIGTKHYNLKSPVFMCLASTDAQLKRRSHPAIDQFSTVWNFTRDTNLLLPADVYLRHLLLAVEKAGPLASQSLLDDTFLVDRLTSLRSYLHRPGVREMVMTATPPSDLALRFGG
uniref:Gamma-glutamylcyclotransferase n=1 Tax=Aureoumbra lagunensis TaxID=44058 RepID=A0A7S3JUC0_9STRA|mmetsp:Transcript_12618/g.16991  ORF Transcript_12618/g.16991 Transcript_12618/m.16991 type:complete len:230 (+) Transcript_12618:3-692(+)